MKKLNFVTTTLFVALLALNLSSCSSPTPKEYVDLGLPSGTMWATCNIGASSPEDYGDMFAWGETATKDNYNKGTYAFADGDSYTKYTSSDGKTQLDLEDDAAHVQWGGDWRMPTADDFAELNENNCTWTWDDSRKGYEVKSKANGNSIFFPCAGYNWLFPGGDEGESGYYWTSTLQTCVEFDSESTGFVDYYMRGRGHSIRPVCKPSAQ